MEKYVELEPDKVYTHTDGESYKCVSDGYGCKLLRRLSDSWTLKPHGVRVDERGAIFWSYSTGGEWQD